MTRLPSTQLSDHGPEIDGIDTSGWSPEWRRRLRQATPGLSVPRNTPRGRSEQRFLAILLEYPEGVRFRQLCDRVGEPPNDSWNGVGQWVRELLMDLKRVGSVYYNDRTRRWAVTGRGALVADANAEWVQGPVDA